MDKDNEVSASNVSDDQPPAIRYLVESALRKVISGKDAAQPKNRQEWVAYLAEALISESDTPYQSVISSMMANGISSEEVFQRYVPDAARFLGEMWVNDTASFVDVTLGAARLQKLFRNREAYSRIDWRGRNIPLGHSVLMVIPPFEAHSLGAFVAADDLRRHGLWVHMGIGMEGQEIAELMQSNRFSMLGVTLATSESLKKAADLLHIVKKSVDTLPPIVIGGYVTVTDSEAVSQAGADFMARTAQEAISLCGLPTIHQSLVYDEFR
jgi:methanogenic corrinoid protein MtbC1